jgi:galactokinase
MFVIAHTMVTADKHVTAPVCYNLRVVETRLASLMLYKLSFPNDGDKWQECVKLRQYQQSFMSLAQNADELKANNNGAGNAKLQMIKSLEIMLEQVERFLTNKDGYTLNQVASVVGMEVRSAYAIPSNSSLNYLIKESELKQRYMSKFPIRADVFHLYRRAKHVFSEALRVYQFRELCFSKGLPDVYEKLGHLMNESQSSCRDLFDCSCPELDELTNLAR